MGISAMLLIEGELILRSPSTCPERELQKWVEDYAADQGWMYYHTVDSRFNISGFPDLVLVRDKSFLVVELKRQSGIVKPAQKKWLLALEQAGVEVWTWRPTDIPSIIERLRNSSGSESVPPNPSSGS